MYSIYVSVLQMDIVLSVAIIRKGNIILLKKLFAAMQSDNFVSPHIACYRKGVMLGRKSIWLSPLAS